MDSASLTAAHTSVIQRVKVQNCCFKLDFQPPPNSRLRVLFSQAGFSKIKTKTTTPHVHQDILSVPQVRGWKDALHVSVQNLHGKGRIFATRI